MPSEEYLFAKLTEEAVKVLVVVVVVVDESKENIRSSKRGAVVMATAPTSSAIRRLAYAIRHTPFAATR